MVKKIFITGIDTNIGKTIFTGLFAKYLMDSNKSVITHKIVQTGSEKISDDIKIHREIMGLDLLEEDLNNITNPYIFKFPASPHLSSKLEKKSIDVNIISKTISQLEKKYEYILIEGAGGIYVPLDRNTYIVDYIQKNNFPIILVTSPKLGSINQTLMSLEILKQKNIDVLSLVYNDFIEENDLIKEDSKSFLKNYINQNFPNCNFLQIKNKELVFDKNFKLNF